MLKKQNEPAYEMLVLMTKQMSTDVVIMSS